jgi:hypothetical protein
VIPSVLARHFVVNKALPWNSENNSLLGLRTSFVGKDVDRSLIEFELQRFDDLVRAFATKGDAQEAQSRLKFRGENTAAIALRCGTWILIPENCVAATAHEAWRAADGIARRNERAAVYKADDGVFVVVDPRIAGDNFGELLPRPAGPAPQAA